MKRISKNFGFTLVELLVGMAILVTLMVIAIGTINPIAMVGKAKDSRRKSDLNKIKTAFEEYFNDKGYYPTSADLTTWNVSSNCDKAISAITKYLKVWPCDPDKKVYTMITKNNWFKVVTNLENKKDDDIPSGWYTPGSYPTSEFNNRNIVNYGVSSTNILWYEGEGFCDTTTCFKNGCQDFPGNVCVSNGTDTICHRRSNNLNNPCNDPLCEVSSCSK